MNDNPDLSVIFNELINNREYAVIIENIKKTLLSNIFKQLNNLEQEYYIQTPNFNNLLQISNFSPTFGYDLYVYSNVIHRIIRNIDKNRGIFEIRNKLVAAMTKTNIVFAVDLSSSKFNVNHRLIIKKTASININDTLLKAYYKEYIYGKFYINKLRYKVPNFMGTLTGFSCPKTLYNQDICMNYPINTPYIILEEVKGEPLFILIKKGISFKNYLLILSQIVAALHI